MNRSSRHRLHALCATVLCLLVVAAPARSAEPWVRFAGTYQGEALTNTGGALRERDLEVEIVAEGRGFRLRWTAVTRRDDGKIKRKEYSVDFRPSKRDGLFESAMRKDMFGNRVPLDPMRGDPYVWARIEGETLSVFSLLISDSGSYDMQVYHRTLIEDGLSVRYKRFAEGEVLRTVEGVLRRVK